MRAEVEERNAPRLSLEQALLRACRAQVDVRAAPTQPRDLPHLLRRGGEPGPRRLHRKRVAGLRRHHGVAEGDQAALPWKGPRTEGRPILVEQQGSRGRVRDVESFDEQRARRGRRLEDLEGKRAERPVGDDDHVPELRPTQGLDPGEEPLTEGLRGPPPAVAGLGGEIFGERRHLCRGVW